MAEASHDARAQGSSRFKHDLPNLLTPLHIISSSWANMTVDSFRLTLLPVWMTKLPFDGREHLVLINGQNGTVKSELRQKPPKSGGLMELLGDLLKE